MQLHHAAGGLPYSPVVPVDISRTDSTVVVSYAAIGSLCLPVALLRKSACFYALP